MNAKGDANRSVRMTKKRLSAALVSLLLQKPVREITVRELTAQAKVSRGTFYFHYADIYDLLHQIEQEQLDKLGALMGTLLPRIGQERPPEALEALFRYLDENRDVCSALYGPGGDPAFAQRVKEVIAENCVDYIGMAGSGERRQYLMDFAVNGCFGTVMAWFERGRRPSAKSMAEITWEAICAVEQLLKTDRN